MEFDRYTVALLRWPPDMRAFTDAELERSQSGHLEFLARMREGGALAVSGPFEGQADEALRGLSVYRTGLEETRALTAGDPAVQMGRLAPELVTWLVPRGAYRLG